MSESHTVPTGKEDTQTEGESDLIQPEDASPLGITFTTIPLTEETNLKHAVIDTSPDTCKLVILAHPVSPIIAEKLSKRLFEIVTTLNLSGTYAEAEMSPVIRKQFDFVLFEVPLFRGPLTMEYFLTELQEAFK